MFRAYPLLAALLAGAPAAAAQDGEPPWPFLGLLERYREARPESPLAGLLFLTESEERARADARWRALYFDVRASAAAIAGDHASALAAESEHLRADGAGRVEGAFDLSGLAARPAAEALLAASSRQRVVVLNEEHRVSQQRAFLAETVERFAALGFTHLALEALAEDPAALRARGHAVASTGLYTKDPAFADALRRALAAGMELVRYEPEGGGNAPGERDRLAGETLARLLAEDPDARLLVYCGRYHLAELGDATWKPLAAVLKEKSGIDPLTVELSSQRELHDRADEHPAYRAADERGLLGDAPVVLAAADGALFSHWPGQVDVTVFFPRTRMDRGRPHWLAAGRGLVPLELGLDGPPEEPLLARAALTSDSADAIAADQCVVWPGAEPPVLLVAPGEYRLQVLRRDGTTVLDEVRQVPESARERR